MCPNIDNGAIVYDKYRRDLLEEVAEYGRELKFRRVCLYDFSNGYGTYLQVKAQNGIGKDKIINFVKDLMFD